MRAMAQSYGRRDSTDGREALCRRCGRCCCAKLIISGEVVYTPHFCKHLDPATRLCTIYERRFEINPDCMTVEEGIRCGVFPADCPYVQGIENYRPPREHWTAQERALFEDIVRRMKNVGDRLPARVKPSSASKGTPLSGEKR